LNDAFQGNEFAMGTLEGNPLACDIILSFAAPGKVNVSDRLYISGEFYFFI
jgi:hypothetical protein